MRALVSNRRTWRVAPVLVALAFAGLHAPAAWAQTVPVDAIGTATYGSSSTAITALGITLTQPAAVERTVLVSVVLYDQVESPDTSDVTVTDASGNTYTADADVINSNLIRTMIFSARINSALSIASTITVHIANGVGGTPWISASALAVNLLVPTSPADRTETAMGGLNETFFLVGPTATTTQPDQLIFAAFGLDIIAGSPTFVAGDGYTAAGASVTPGYLGIYPAYRTVNATGAYSADASISSGSLYGWAAAMVTYKIAPVSAANSTVSASPTTLVADGTATTTITITAKDAEGRVMPGIPAASVVVAATGSNNILVQPATATDANGQTTATLRATVAELKTISATIKGTPITQTAAVTFTAATTNGLRFTTQPVDTTAASTMANVVVQIQDPAGNPVAQSGVAVTLTLNGSVLYSGTNPQTTDSNGTATFNDLVIQQTGTGLTLDAAATGLLWARSATFSITPLPASKLGFTTQPVNTPAGSTMANVVVQVQDAYGNAVAQSDTDITLTLNGSEFYAGTNPLLTDASGKATFSDVIIQQAGTGLTFDATAESLTGATSNAFNITALAAVGVGVETAADGSGAGVPSQSISAGDSLQVYAITRDMYGNFVANVAATAWTLENRTGYVVSGDLMPAGDSKSALFTGHGAGTATIRATWGELTYYESGVLTVVPAAFVKLQILLPGEAAAPGTTSGKIGTPTARQAGTAFNVTVNAVDNNWNVLNTVTDLVEITSTDSGATLPVNVALVAGTKIFSITLNTIGSQTVTASDLTNPYPLIAPGVSSEVTVIAGPANKLAYTSVPTTGTAGVAFSVTVQSQDLAGNPANVTSATAISLDAETGGGSLSGTLTGTIPYNSDSVTITGIVYSMADTMTLTASRTSGMALSPVTSGPIVFSAGAAVKLAYTVVPSTGIAGTPFSVTVQSQDANGNPASPTGDTTITLSKATGGGTLSGVLTGVIPASGNSVTISTPVYSRADTMTLTASHTLGGAPLTSVTSGPIVFSAGAFSKLQILVPGETAASGTATGKTGTPDDQTSGVSFTITVNAVDDNWNVVSTVTDVVGITSSDGSAVLPANAALAGGTRTFGVTLQTVGSSTLTATDITDGTKAPDTSPSITVADPATNAYRSNGTGNWNATGTWQRFDGTTWVAAASTPTSGNSTAIIIRGGHTVTVTANVTVDQVIVSVGGQVTITSGDTWTIANGADTDLDVYGTVRNAGTVTMNGAGVFETGGKYQHNINGGGTIPTASWNANSTVEIVGYTNSTTAPSGLGQAFGNFIWNSPSQTGHVSLAGALSSSSGSSIAGDFTITSIGTGSMRLANSTNNARTLFVIGDFIQSAGRFYVLGDGGNSSSMTLDVGGDFSLTGGTLTLTARDDAGTINVAGDFRHTGGTINETSSGAATIVFDGAGTQIYTGGGTVSNTIGYTVNSGATVQLVTSGSLGSTTGTFTVNGTLDATSVALTGTGTNFDLNSGGTLRIGDANGITSSGTSGSIRTSGGTRTFDSGANYVYGGGVAQVTGSGLPGTVNSLTVSASGTYLTLAPTAGDTTTTRALTVSTNLTVDAGQFDQNACSSTHTLTVDRMLLANGGNYINCNSANAGGTSLSTLTFASPNTRPQLSVGSGSTFDYVGSGAITFSGAGATTNVSNAGVIRINGGGRTSGEATCGVGQVSISSTVTNAWATGSGSFYLADVALTSQVSVGSAVPLYGNSSADSNSTGWGTVAASCTTGGPGGGAAPTAVRFQGFAAELRDAGGVLLTWQTGYEVSNLGFHVYRDGVRITPSPIAGSALLAGARTVLTAGQAYRWVDEEGTASSTYTLEDLDLDGTKTVHGPFGAGGDATPERRRRGSAADPQTRQRAERTGAARPGVTAAASPLVAELGRSGSRDSRWFSTRPGDVAPEVAPVDAAAPDVMAAADVAAAADMTAEADSAAARIGQQYALARGRALKVGVRQAGWYAVSAAQLVAAGMPAFVSPVTLQLFVNGAEQAILVRQAGGRVTAVEFYGEGVDTPWSDTQAYWLTWGSRVGRRIQTYIGRGRGMAPVSFPSTLTWQPRQIYFPALLNGDADNFFGPALEPTTPVVQALPVAQVDAGASGVATLTVRMQGVTEGAHVVGVDVNGTWLGSVTFVDTENGVGSFPLPAALMASGATLTLTAAGGGNDVTLVDTVTLTYPRRYIAEGDVLRCTAPVGQPVVIGGFSTNQIRVMDVTDPAHVTAPQGIVAAQAGGGYAVTLAPLGGGTRTLLAFTDATMNAPAGVEANAPSLWHAAQSGADLVVVTHEAFVESVAPLVALRQAQGLTVAVVNVEDVYDEFSDGVPSAYAVKDFLATARAVWTTAPRWALLVGDATQDPRDYFGMHAVNYVPAEMVGTTQLETASDDWFGDGNDDGVPELAIGRLPVRSASDAAALVAKIVAYDAAAAAAWKQNALLVAGTNDAENDFEAHLSAVQALLPSGMAVTTVKQGSTPAPAAAFLTAFNGGQGLVNFAGHGSTEIWQGGLFGSTAAGTVTNGAATPFVIAMTCLNGYFADVWTFSLAEAMLTAPGGGAVGVWASSGLTDSAPQAALNQAMISALYGGPSITVGEAVLAAKAAVADPDVRKSWILFGDPSMRIW